MLYFKTNMLYCRANIIYCKTNMIYCKVNMLCPTRYKATKEIQSMEEPRSTRSWNAGRKF